MVKPWEDMANFLLWCCLHSTSLYSHKYIIVIITIVNTKEYWLSLIQVDVKYLFK